MDKLDILYLLLYKFDMMYDNAIEIIKHCEKNDKLKLLQNSTTELNNLNDLIDKIYAEI